MTQNNLSSMSGTQDPLSSVGSEIENANPPLTAEVSSNTLQLMPESVELKIIDAIKPIVEAYATQQTAAKDARIAELEADILDISKFTCEQYKKAKAELYARIAELEAENERIGGLLEEWGGKYHRLLTERDALQAKLDAIDVREYSRLIGENECLKAKLDDAIAQVAMLVEVLQELDGCPIWVDEATVPKGKAPDDPSNPPYQVVCNASISYTRIQKAKQALNQTQPAAEAYKAELLKPYQWRHMVSAPCDHPYDTEVLIAHGYHGDTGGPCSVDRAWWDNNRKGWRRYSGLIPDPQYWMPIPQLPEATEEHNAE